VRRFLIIAIISLFLSSLANAHPGGTDLNGGHRDSSTGEYHYHHGYSAHQHTNGVCPYESNNTTVSSGRLVPVNPRPSGHYYSHDNLPAHEHLNGICPYNSNEQNASESKTDISETGSKSTSQQKSSKLSFFDRISDFMLLIVMLTLGIPYLVWIFCIFLNIIVDIIKDIFSKKK
jgi:hypothetical protein